VTVLYGDESCDFSSDLLFGAMLKYSVLDNHVEIPVGSEALNNPVVLRGNSGEPVWGIAAYAEQVYRGNIYLTGRAGLDIWTGHAYGYSDSSTMPRLADGTLISEEFHLDRLSVLLTLSPGVQYYFAKRKAYLFGLLNVSLPLYTSETLTRTILTPSNYVYEGGEGTLVMHDGSGPSGFPIIFVPEIGIGASVEIRSGWRAYAELGAGYSLTSISPGRDWTVSYLFGRGGAKLRF